MDHKQPDVCPSLYRDPGRAADLMRPKSYSEQHSLSSAGPPATGAFCSPLHARQPQQHFPIFPPMTNCINFPPASTLSQVKTSNPNNLVAQDGIFAFLPNNYSCMLVHIYNPALCRLFSLDYLFVFSLHGFILMH